MMSVEHEYSVIGHSRSSWGRRLGAIAGGVAAFGVLVAGAVLGLAEQLGLGKHVPEIVLWPFTAASVYAGVHWLFNRFIWRWRWFSKVLGVPDLSGRWRCKGQTLNPVRGAVANWEGELVISQSWEKIRVHLCTANSESQSKAASLIYEPGTGFRLLYSYFNLPGLGQRLHAHIGYSEIVFDEELSRGNGEYFNNKGRVTYGTMMLERLV
ncbi:MAG TPA: hypothetical protein VF655_09225 [Allosphingosinicella sp.]|jgi:hypothetical protein